MISQSPRRDIMPQQRRAPNGGDQPQRQPLDAPRPSEYGWMGDSAVSVELHDSIERAFRPVVEAARQDGAITELDERSRQCLNEVCALAHRDTLRIEQLLLLLKDGWRHQPEVQRTPRVSSDITLACVITHCIKEFYRPDRSS